MGQIQITVSIVMIALFAVAVIGFAINFAVDNNAPMSISQDSGFSELNTNLNGNLSGFSSSTEGQYQSILETTIAPGSQGAQSSGPFATTIDKVMGSAFSITKVAYTKIFGTDSGLGIFITVFISLLLLILGLFLYKTLLGSPD